MKSKTSKNPFAGRGLDEFAKVSAELQAKKQEIISQIGENQADNVLVRFTYSDCRGWVPLVARLNKKEGAEDGKNQKQKTKEFAEEEKPKTVVGDHKLPESPRKIAEKKGSKRDAEESMDEESGSVPKTAWPAWLLSKDAVCFSLLMALVLFCLVLFGKTLAILFTALWWYLIDFMKETSDEVKEFKGCVKKTKSEDSIQKNGDA